MKTRKICGILAAIQFRVILSSCCPRNVSKCKNTKINILPFVLSEHEVSSHTHRLWLFLNGLLSRIFGPERGEGVEVSGCAENRMRWLWHVPRITGTRNAHTELYWTASKQETACRCRRGWRVILKLDSRWCWVQ